MSHRIVRFSANSYYTAAEYSRDRDFFWSSVEANDDAMFDTWTRRTVISRIRREVRNNTWLLGLVEAFPALMGSTALRSTTKDRAFNLIKELWWHRWGKHAEVTGLTWDEVTDIIWRELLQAGEVFCLLLNSGKVQLIPSEHCVRIEYGPNGLPSAYIFEASKDGVLDGQGETPNGRVSARNCIHIYKQDRCRMGRGIPWLMASLIPARDLYEIDGAKTKQIKDANQLFGILKRNVANANRPMDGFAGFSSSGPSVAPETENDAADKPAEDRIIELKNGTVIALETGEDIDLKRPEYQTTDHAEFLMLKLNAMSAPLGIPVQFWYDGIGLMSFSGVKGLGAQWNNRRKRHLEWFESAFLDRVQFWRASKAAKDGEIPKNPDGDDDAISWGWKSTAVLDELSEAKGSKMRIDAGISDVAQELERSGQFIEDAFARRAATWAKAQEACGINPPAPCPVEYLLFGQLPGQPGAQNLWAPEPPQDDAPPAAPGGKQKRAD